MNRNKGPFLTFLAAVFVLFMCDSAFCAVRPIAYRITAGPDHLGVYQIEMHIPDARGTVRLAMAAHPEYDDRYFRYIENFSAESGGSKLLVSRPEDAVWQVNGVRGDVTVRYRVTPAAKEREWRQTWKPFLTPTGGRVGDLHMLMYVVGTEKRQARLSLDMPAGWKAVSGLERTSEPHTFVGSVEEMLDSPVLIGDVREWKFTAGGVPHTVAIWSLPDAKPVDAARIVEGIQKLAYQAVKAFGKPPYPRYAFLLENGGQAGLEHRTSLNAGIGDDLNGLFQGIAHEYIHVWNLMDVRPRERVGLRYRFAEPTGVLWWSEGATIYFSDVLMRRAGLEDVTRTRLQRLGSLIARYLSAPGYSTLPAELVSRGDSHPELLGDDWAGTHLQGELLVTMLDLKIRDASDGRSSVDDVMRLLASRFDIDRGIVNSDIEAALAEVCQCEMKGFFREHIYAAKQIEFDRYLDVIGMHAEITRVPAVDAAGRPSVDLRIGPVSPEGELRLRITNTNSAWARAGIRTGDKLISAGGKTIPDWAAFRNWLRALKVGDEVQLVVEQGGASRTIDVRLAAFDVPSVRIVERETATQKQIRLRNAWASGN